jgi:hypothetical protein
MVNNLKNNKLTFQLYFFLCLLGYQDDYKYGKEYLPKKKYYDEYEK